MNEYTQQYDRLNEPVGNWLSYLSALRLRIDNFWGNFIFELFFFLPVIRSPSGFTHWWVIKSDVFIQCFSNLFLVFICDSPVVLVGDVVNQNVAEDGISFNPQNDKYRVEYQTKNYSELVDVHPSFNNNYKNKLKDSEEAPRHYLSDHIMLLRMVS